MNSSSSIREYRTSLAHKAIFTLPVHGMLQRAAVNHLPTGEVPRVVHEVLRSPGQPLDAQTRAFMEPRFGHDFSGVRVHADSKAAESARAVSALAYTVGRDVVFSEGQHMPETSAGRRLMAHELTHVVQQQGAISSHGLRIAPIRDQYEEEAEHFADSLPTHHKASNAPTGMLQRQFVTPIAAGGGFGGLMERDRRRIAAAPLTEEERALQQARSLETTYPGWYNVLPDCPCTVDAARASSEFKEDSWLTTLVLDWFGYHPGAVDSFRTKRGYPSQPGTSHGQQCVYDRRGRLITDGPGAGTPDLWSPETHYDNHQTYDVRPFDILGWQVYNRYWPPNKGQNCPANNGNRQD